MSAPPGKKLFTAPRGKLSAGAHAWIVRIKIPPRSLRLNYFAFGHLLWDTCNAFLEIFVKAFFSHSHDITLD